MKLGFTGTRRGLTVAQQKAIHDWIVKHDNIGEFHHGDCVGADADVDYLVLNLCPSAKRVSHPSDIEGMRANCKADEVHEPLPPLVRNKIIVDSCDEIIAAPAGAEELRSGTWSTIRYAMRTGKPYTIFKPNGVEESNH